MSCSSLISLLVDEPIVVVEMNPLNVSGSLFSVEHEAVERAVSKRIQHFTAGRVCARRALQVLGLSVPTAIPMGEDGAPQWPPGFIGSISHTEGWCAAAVAPRSRVRAVGIDIEQADPLKVSLIRHICTDKERFWLVDRSDSALMAKIIFSAKESLYKCQYPLTGQFLGFQDAAIELGNQSFKAIFLRDVGEFRIGDTIVGRFVINKGLVATACSIQVL